jgi:predicted nucleotide-binding protein
LRLDRRAEKGKDQLTVLPDLKRRKSDIEGKIKTQISKGRGIQRQTENTWSPLEGDELRNAVKKWSAYNLDLFTRAFVTDSVAKEYAQIAGTIEDRLESRIEFLQSTLESLELVEETSGKSDFPLSPISGQHVFLIHGHDEAANQTVSRFVEKLGLTPTRLDEQPNLGRTLIEKLEENSNVPYAIALMTSDDIATSKERKEKKEQWKPRARQNVIFELGNFVGRLGRGRVCILYKTGVDIPSDYRGVGWGMDCVFRNRGDHSVRAGRIPRSGSHRCNANLGSANLFGPLAFE